MTVAATAVLLVVSACSGDDEPGDTSSTSSSAAASATVDGTDPPPVASTTTTTTSTDAPVASESDIGETVLVAAEDGVYQIDRNGDVELLVAGPVAYAVDDTQGGLLFQVDRGRTWEDEDSWSTIVWWIPRGASAPQELLVPTPETGHQLSLHDTYATDDGFAVLYTRHEGVTPNVDINDRLRRFDVPARRVTDLYSQGAFEQGFDQVSTNGELIAGVWHHQVGSGCFIYDLDGQPAHLVPEEASDHTSEDYVSGCRLSPQGDRLVFTTVQSESNERLSTTLHAWDLTADEEVARFVVPRDDGRVVDIEVSEANLMANIVDEDHQKTLVFSLNAPERAPVALPIPGMARFVDTPVGLGAPVHVGAGPDFYRYGDDGLFRVVDGVETQLEAAPVLWAADDLMGGVIYRFHWQIDAETTYWLKADGSRETFGYRHPQFVAVVVGEPTSAMIVSDEWDADSFDHDVDLLLVGLRSGTERRLPNIGFDGDGWSFPLSHGDGLFVGVDGAAVGCGGSDSVISFWDGDGNRIDHPHNPVAESCGPCELSAAISPDGRLLAYSHRADAPSDYHGRLVCGGHDEWWNETQEILANVVVLDLGQGDELFRVTAPARASVVDFDGRYVVVDQGDWVEDQRSVIIYDTWGVHEPIALEGGVALIRQSPNLVLRHDGLGAVSFGDPVDDVMAILTEQFGAPTRDDLYESPFEVPADWDRGDRGPSACHVGTTGNVCFDYIRFVWWEQEGLSVLFSDIEANPEATTGDEDYWTQVPPSFRGYGYRGSEIASLYTAHGITVGSTTEDLLTLGSIVSFGWDACGGYVDFRISDQGKAVRGLLDDQDFEAFDETGVANESATVVSLEAGQRGSC
jgi:hypothetical protein